MTKAEQNQLISMQDATRLLKAGSVGVIPTDTVYGLVTSAKDPQAVARLYALKCREGKPGTVVAGNIQQLLDLGIDERHTERVGQWWPNPLSVVLPAGVELEYLHQGRGSLAVRIPKDKALLEVLLQTGPLITSSANQPGELESTTVDEAVNYFGDTVDFYVDGGDLSGRAPSTIIRLTDENELEILRRGALDGMALSGL